MAGGAVLAGSVDSGLAWIFVLCGQYGALAAIIVLMLWLYIVSMILLMGPQLNHTLVVMRLYRLENEKHL